jgi:hypothetical protein
VIAVHVSGTVMVGIAIVVTTAVVSAVTCLAVQHFGSAIRKESRNDVTAVYFNMIGVLYAILLAFVVVVAWEQFNAAGAATETEVTRMSNLWRDAGGLAPEPRDQIRANLTAYLQDVIEEEFVTMAHGEASPIAQRSYEAVWDRYYTLEPAVGNSQSFFSESLTRLNELGAARRIRLLASRSSIPIPLWILLIGGGGFTIAWLCLFWMDSNRLQVGMIAAVGGFTGFILFLIYALQHPFAGTVAVSSDVYQELLAAWQR